MTTTGFIGLGRMGRPLAGHLQQKGFALTVHDLAAAPMRHLESLGASTASDVASLARASSTVFMCLPSHVEMEAIAIGPGGIAEHAAAGTLVVDLSTVDPGVTDRVAVRLGECGMRFVDAPIGRLASHADRAESLFMVGASDADFAEVLPMLEAMGTTIHHCGPVGNGIRTKLVNNFLAIASCQMNAEALALSQRFGLDLGRTLEVIHGTSASNGQLKMNYATKVLTGDVEPGFQIDLAHKDLSLVLSAANAGAVPMAMGAAARESLNLARARGYGAKDFSALADALCEAAGIEPARFAPGANAG